MMLTMAMQSTTHNSLFPHSSFPCHAPSSTAKTIGRASSLANPTNKVGCSSMDFEQKRRPISRNAVKLRAIVDAEYLGFTGSKKKYSGKASWDVDEELNEVEVEPIEKPRLVLKFIWMEKNIGLALDQLIPGYGAVPLSPYFFWPRKDAWEELKTTLESKPWISQKKMIILLNQATDIINLWQQSGGNLTSSS